MLTIDNLHVDVENKEVLKGINLNIPDNEVHTLFGPNGSGKSVLISTLMGYPEYKITQGEIIFNNQKINDLSIDERVKLGLGVSEQRPPTIKGVKLKNLIELLVPGILGDEVFKRNMIDHYDMSKFLERNINDGLSGGEMKKSELFLVLITKPEFLILDEPDSGVDPEHMIMIGSMINETLLKERCEPMVRNSGLIATHSAAILNYIHTDKAHVLLDGKIHCSGNPAIMMDQIRKNGYSYCIKCQNNLMEDQL